MIERYIKRISKHTAVYWGDPSPGADGTNVYAEPCEIKCFWKGETELSIQTAGNTVAVAATVYVSQDLSEQGVLYLGCLEDLTTEQKNNPMKVRQACEIVRFVKDPSLHLDNAYNRRALLIPTRSRK